MDLSDHFRINFTSLLGSIKKKQLIKLNKI